MRVDSLLLRYKSQGSNLAHEKQAPFPAEPPHQHPLRNLYIRGTRKPWSSAGKALGITWSLGLEGKTRTLGRLSLLSITLLLFLAYLFLGLLIGMCVSSACMSAYHLPMEARRWHNIP